MTGTQELWQAFDALIGDGEPTALLVVGPPRCGKTEFAFETMMRVLEGGHGIGAMMTVSGRVAADRLGNLAIRRIGASMRARPVTTLSALAFAVIADARRYDDLPAPRLLNGAEQDALLRRVMAQHLGHAATGDLCDTCLLLREYFADDHWSEAVAPAQEQTDDATTAAMFERGVSSSFVDQLRDMLARINELGASFAHEDEYLAGLGGAGRNADRIRVQWRLAFALRREYVQAIERAYPGNTVWMPRVCWLRRLRYSTACGTGRCGCRRRPCLRCWWWMTSTTPRWLGCGSSRRWRLSACGWCWSGIRTRPCRRSEAPTRSI